MSTAKQALREVLLKVSNPRLLLPEPKTKRAKIERILVIRPDHLGDLLFATEALRRIRLAFPEAHITGLVGPWGKAMWQGNRHLDELKTISFPGIAGKEGGPLAPYHLLRKEADKLRQENYSLGITLRFDHWWGAALMKAAGIPRRWGYDTPGMKRWLTGAVPYIAGLHEVEQNLKLVEAVLRRSGAGELAPLDIDRNKGIPQLQPPAAEPTGADVVQGWLAATRRAVIHPGTMSANKLWTIEGWAQVARGLMADGWSVALTGSPQEKPLVDAIYERIGEGSILNLAGVTPSISHLVGVLQQAHMVLGVDSGPLHIATALGKPTLHLYGPSDETIWGPWGDPTLHRAVRARGTAPSHMLDIGSNGLEGGPEMRAISVEQVVNEIAALKAVASNPWL